MTMKLPRSAGKAIVAEQANRRLRRLYFWGNDLAASDDRAVPPATEQGLDSLGFALMDSHGTLRATS
jgi:hypothetical protein